MVSCNSSLIVTNAIFKQLQELYYTFSLGQVQV